MIKFKHLPLKKIEVNSKFGLRNITTDNNKYWWHNGTDFRASVGEEVFSAADGVVKVAKDNSGGYGLYVVVDSGSFGVLYAHLSKYIVSEGETVESGQLIGYTGDTGDVTGPHLHFELRECRYENFWDRCACDKSVFMRCVDPYPYIENCIKRDKLTKTQAEEIIQQETGYSNKTMLYLNSYLYRDDLILKAGKTLI